MTAIKLEHEITDKPVTPVTPTRTARRLKYVIDKPVKLVIEHFHVTLSNS